MSEKIMSRQKLDALIELVRELCDSPFEHGNVDRLCKACIRAAQDIEADIGEKTGVLWSGPHDLVWSILHAGLKKGATNKDIYQVLEVLGWEVREDAN